MIQLPSPPNLSLLRGFAASVGAWTVLLACSAAALAGTEAYAVAGIVGGGAVWLAGWWRPETLLGMYRLWNRAAAVGVRGGRLVFTMICFLIVSAAGRPGSRLPWGPPAAGATGWRPRAPDGGRRSEAAGIAVRDSWVRSYVAWTGSSDTRWALALLPYLWLIRALHSRERGSLDDQMYTLY